MGADILTGPKPRLTQKRLFELREVRVDDFSVWFRKEFYRTNRERSIPIEDLVLDQVIRGHRIEGMSLFLTGIFLLLAVVSLHTGNDPRVKPNWIFGCFWGLVSIGMATYCWMRSGSYVVIPLAGQEAFEIYGTIPTRASVDAFLEQLSNHVNAYARAKYGTISSLQPFDQQMERLTWLRQRNFLSDAEFNGKVGELERRVKGGPERPIGFRPNN
jgi:hypothetical protein